MKTITATIGILLGTLGLLLASGLHAETWRFAVIGDVPYNSYEERQLPLMLDDIAAEHPQFIVHAGDFKSSSKPCSDALFRDRRTLFDASQVPLIYVPGDNEWTDCRRLAAGGFDPLERLQKLRELFFATPRSLGRQRWRSNNSLAPIPSSCAGASGRCSSYRSTCRGRTTISAIGKRPARSISLATRRSSNGWNRALPPPGAKRPPAW
jgi:hypothetical protein